MTLETVENGMRSFFTIAANVCGDPSREQHRPLRSRLSALARPVRSAFKGAVVPELLGREADATGHNENAAGMPTTHHLV